MKRVIPILFILLYFSSNLHATHNRAGEITLTQLDEYTYEILITTFTYTLSMADRSSLEVQWGDNSFSTAPRISVTTLPNFYQKNVYITQHTFPGPGTFEIVVQDPNRNRGVKNIPNSVNVVFSIKTTISINPTIGLNSTPVLLNPPIDRAALNQIFIHNPAAFDPDGDSISYKLTVCTEQDGKAIEDYELPSTSDTIYIDPYTGDLVWSKPDEIGIYNIALDIEEWRSGVKIGNIIRDMQIEVYETDNNIPELDSLGNFCIEAGTSISFKVVANDKDNDSITLSAAGGPLIVENSPAVFTPNPNFSSLGHSEGQFEWNSNCSHVRQQFYTIVFKAEDSNPETKLVDIKNVNIKVIGPAPATPNLIPASNSITVTWSAYSCPNIIGYRLYRKEGPYAYVADSCTTGVPSFTGYELIAYIDDPNDTIYADDGNGLGLEQGSEYCYMLTAVFPDGAESYPSEETCTPLVAGVPAILQVSVTKDSNTGDIELKWAEPQDLDTIPALGPYEYIITRYKDLLGQQVDEVLIKNSADISDTTFTDNSVNTELFPYSYSIELFNNEAGNRFPISDEDAIELASSFYPMLEADDNRVKITMVKNVPWINNEYTIYRFNESSGLFDSIGFTTENTYTDYGLKNFTSYCYKIRSRGWRSINDRFFENTNFSHINCATPEDKTPPCTPILTGRSYCDEFYNEISWRFESDTCLEDVEGYKLYFSATENGVINEISEYQSKKSDTSYIDIKTDASLTGCYYVAAIDSFGNESAKSARLCLDECSNYVLPNVFSPNNDRENDLYTPLRTAFVEKVDFQVFNRWGLLVFRTEDPDLNWDGKIQNSDKLVSPGVYYYICEVFEPRLGGIESYTLTGFIYVYSGKENSGFIAK